MQYGSSPRQLWPGEIREYDKVAAIVAPRPLPISAAPDLSNHVGFLHVELNRLVKYIDGNHGIDKTLTKVRYSGLVESLTQVLVVPDDISPELETTVYSMCRSCIRIVAVLLQRTVKAVSYHSREECLYVALTVLGVVVNVMPGECNKLLTCPRFGMYGTADDAWMYTCALTRFPSSGAGRYLVGLITDCMHLGMFDSLAELVHMDLRDSQSHRSGVLNSVSRRSKLFHQLLIVPFRVLEPEWYRNNAVPMLGVIARKLLDTRRSDRNDSMAIRIVDRFGVFEERLRKNRVVPKSYSYIFDKIAGTAVEHAECY